MPTSCPSHPLLFAHLIFFYFCFFCFFFFFSFSSRFLFASADMKRWRMDRGERNRDRKWNNSKKQKRKKNEAKKWSNACLAISAGFFTLKSVQWDHVDFCRYRINYIITMWENKSLSHKYTRTEPCACEVVVIIVDARSLTRPYTCTRTHSHTHTHADCSIRWQLRQ